MKDKCADGCARGCEHDRNLKKFPQHTPGPTVYPMPCGCEFTAYSDEFLNVHTEMKRCPLHAAASDLLEAAKAALDLLEDTQLGDDKTGTMGLCPSSRMLRAAIAKAEGKAR